MSILFVLYIFSRWITSCCLCLADAVHKVHKYISHCLHSISQFLSAKRTQFETRLMTLPYGNDASDLTPSIFSKNRLMTRSLIIECRGLEQLRRRYRCFPQACVDDPRHASNRAPVLPDMHAYFQANIFFPIISHLNSN